MNLETFKARARRKLELPPRRTQSETARTTTGSAAGANSETEQHRKSNEGHKQQPASNVQSTESNTDKFAAAMSYAHNEELKRSSQSTRQTDTVTTPSTSSLTPATPATPAAPAAPAASTKAAPSTPPASKTTQPAATPTTAAVSTSAGTTSASTTSAATTSAKSAAIPAVSAFESSSEKPTNAPLSAYAQPYTQQAGAASYPESEASELSRLRSLLLGDRHQNQQDQVNAVYERTQTGINDLRQDIDARLDNLTKYVGALEQSILNSIEVRAEVADQQQWSIVAETTEARVQEHNERIDAFDAKLANTLSNLRAEFEADRESDRAYLKKELAEANTRTDKLLDNVSSRLETSIASIEARLSKQLTTQSAGLVADSESTVSNLRAQLGNLIDDRVRSFNDKQSSGLDELRDILLTNTQQLNDEIKSQTEQQRNTLNAHRTEMEKQLNSAINELNQSKVSHKDLAQLLGRLADRLKHL